MAGPNLQTAVRTVMRKKMPRQMAKEMKPVLERMNAVMKRAERAGKTRSAGDVLATVGVLAGSSMGMLGALKLMSAGKEKATRQSDFSAALSMAPSLKSKKVEAMQHFLTLRRLNKPLSRDPVLAAGYMKKAITFNNEGIDPAMVINLQQDRDTAGDVWKGLQRAVPGAGNL